MFVFINFLLRVGVSSEKASLLCPGEREAWMPSWVRQDRLSSGQTQLAERLAKDGETGLCSMDGCLHLSLITMDGYLVQIS
jgi:hypothetical protein